MLYVTGSNPGETISPDRLDRKGQHDHNTVTAVGVFLTNDCCANNTAQTAELCEFTFYFELLKQ